MPKDKLSSIWVRIFLSLSSIVPTTSQGQWTCEPPMPTARWALTVVAGSDGLIYAIGGLGDSGILDTVEAYDALFGTWTALAPMPTPRDNLAGALACDGRIFVFGGSRDDAAPVDTVEVYDPSTDSWCAAASMPASRSGVAAVTGTDGKIYVIGGSRGGYNWSLVTSNVDVYDHGTNTWAAAAPLPRPRSHLVGALGHDGKIYAIGGRDPSRGYSLNDVTVYDPRQDNWRTLSVLPTSRYNLAAVVATDGRIYAIGGYRPVIFLAVVEAYDPTTDRWTSIPSTSVEREGLGAARGPDDRIYAIGGSNMYGDDTGWHRAILSSVEAYTPLTTLTSETAGAR